MKKFHSLLLSLFLVFSFILSPNVFAANKLDLDTVVSLQIDNPIMEVNGDCAEIDLGKGTKPVIQNGRTLVPIRAIIEAFGGNVGWDNATRTVTLTMNDDVIELVIESHVARLNEKESTLDVAPVIINERTMLPIRYIAESFNLGVAWNGKTRTVSIVRNGFDESEYQEIMSAVPAYAGSAYVTLNENKPFFKEYEMIDASFEFYGNLDNFGRCDVAMASIGKDIMPQSERESISSVTPTGWENSNYDIIDGGYLYNRCHLIGFQLTGENANKRNLITGTRYLNISGMLPFENMICDYVKETGNHVLYRTTPVFSGDNLLACGVLIEAYSIEDNGEGISLCVYCYNVQPGIFIDYTTGENSLAGETPISPDTPTTYYRTPSGKKYHSDPECGGKNSFATTFEEVTALRLAPCSKCIE